MQPATGWADHLDGQFLHLRGNLGYGVEPPHRRDACSASLRQAQALLRSAIDIDLSVKPLTAFYGLEQAGSAYLAAANKGKSFSPRNHGLSYSTDSVRDAKTIGDVVITLDKPREPEQGAFRMFAEARGHTLPESASASLAQIWSSNVDGRQPLISKNKLVQPLDLSNVPHIIGLAPSKVIDVSFFYGVDSSYDQVAQDYGLSSGRAYVNAWDAVTRNFILTDLTLMKRESNTYAGSTPFLMPAPGTFGSLPPLLNTWILLYGLSICARYLSGLWQLAISPDNSPDYLVLTRALDRLCTGLPVDVVVMLNDVLRSR